MPRGIERSGASHSANPASSSGDHTGAVKPRTSSSQKHGNAHLAALLIRFKNTSVGALSRLSHSGQADETAPPEANRTGEKDRSSQLTYDAQWRIADEVCRSDPAALLALARTSKSWRTAITEDLRFELPEARAKELTGGDPQKLKELKQELAKEAHKVIHIGKNLSFAHELILAAKAAVMNASPFKELHEGLPRLKRAAIKTGLSADPLLDFNVDWIGFLPSSERQAVVDAHLKAYVNERSGPGQEKIEKDGVPVLLAGMAFFTEEQRWAIVKRTIEKALERGRPPNEKLLAALAGQMKHLNREQRDYVFNAVNEIGDKKARADGLRALRFGASQLTEEQCSEALRALIALDGRPPYRVASFAGHMPGLSEGECDSVLDVCIGTGSEKEQSVILIDLAPVLKHCNEAQAGRLLTAGLDLSDAKLKMQVLAAFSTKIASFDEAQRLMMLNEILDVCTRTAPEHFQDDNELARATLRCSAGMAAFDKEQRSSLGNAFFAVIDALGIDFVVAPTEIAMLAKHAEDLTDGQQQQLITLINYRPKALASIAPAFPHLNGEQRESIVSAITRITPDPRFQGDSSEHVHARFGPAVPHLSPGQWRRIFASAKAIPDPILKARALTGLTLRDGA